MSNTLPKNLYPDDFLTLLRRTLPPGFDWNELEFTNRGLVVMKKPSGAKVPLGCKVCFAATKGQTPLGDPTVNGVPLVRGSDILPNANDLAPEVSANLWLCPSCNLPQTSFLPKFV